jgi:tRNA (guanine-N7-)-methyltransferase
MDAKNKKAAPYQDIPTVPEEGAIDLAQVVGAERESVEIEIGFGKGHFILDRAKNNPNTSFWGLEVRRKWVHLVTSRALKRELSNVRVQLGDARKVLPRIATESSVARFFINFPDPWWKARHLKRLVVTDRFIEEVGRLLQNDGELFVQTDVDFRARDYRDILLRQSFLEPASGGNGVIDENPFAARSLREIKCEEIGLPIYRMLFRRKNRT